MLNRAILCSILILGFAVSQKLSAQISSQKGWFESTYNYGCQGLTITITHTRAGAGALFYGFEGSQTDPINGTNFEGSFTEGSSESHTYVDPGTYYVVVVDQSGSGSDADRTDILEITVVADEPPAVIGQACAGNTIELTFHKDEDVYDAYSIQFGDGNSILTDGENPVYHTYTTNGNYTINMQGRFNSGHYFSCSTYEIEFTAFDQIPPAIINSIQVEDETSISIEYEPLEAALNYTLQIDRGTGFEDFIDIDPTVNSESITLDEPSFNTRTNFYGFRIVAEDECQTSTVESEAGYSIAFDIVDESVSNTFEVLISWSTSNQDFSTIELLRDGSGFQTFNTSENTDELLSFSNCAGLGTFSMSTNINSISSTSMSQTPFESNPPELPQIEAPEAELRGAVVEVSFPSTNFPLGEYIVYRRDIGPSFQEVFRSSSNQYTDTTIPGGTGEVCYRIAYEDECGNTSALSEEICLILSTSLGIPNAFSPNGDGINDTFGITEGIYNNFRMAIFNRWGTLVFNSTDPSLGWNGQFEGQPANAGTYLYQISFQNADNLLITKTGSFVLIR